MKTYTPKELSYLTESQLIVKYRSGEVSGITDAPNYTYIPLRVTGSGETIRVDENGQFFVEDRLKSEFFTKDNIEQCGRLPITIGHPKDSLLSPDTIKDAQIVGQTIAAWPEGDEIWALGRIYDKSIINRLGKDLKSTSPGVYSDSRGWINDVHLEAPVEMNHLAFVDVGHWDQKSNIAYRIDKEDIMITQQTDSPVKIKTDETGAKEEVKEVAKEVTELKEHEKQEAKTFEALAKEHANLDTKEEKMPEEKVKVEEAAAPVEEAVAPVEEEVTVIDSESAEIEVVDEGDIEICDDEDEKVDEEEVDEEEVEVKTDSEEEKVDEEEIIIDTHETKADAARIEVIRAMRRVCDSAHPSLGVKMPFISDRETARSIVTKFAKANLHLVSSKYKSLLSARLDAMSPGLASDLFNSMRREIDNRTAKLGSRVKATGWVDTGRGYSVNQNWVRS